MFMKVAAIAFLFLIWLRFPHSKSLSQIIRSRYGDKIVKRLRKFEKIDYRLRKAELDLEFLVKCRDRNMVPKFIYNNYKGFVMYQWLHLGTRRKV